MANKRIPIWLALPVLGVGALIAFVLGLFAYISLTATPLHPDPSAISSVARAATPQWAGAINQARAIVRASVTQQNLPGVSVAVGVNGDIVWAEGFGWANLDTEAPITPDTQFRIAEVSIPLTSAAVGLLLEKGRLKLNDEIQTHVPQFPKKQWPVTLRQLMGHLAGVRGDAGDEESLAPCAKTSEALKRFADDPLKFEPGTDYRPSSYGWVLVSAAIEAAAEEPFFAFMHEHVFEPLGMAATRPDSATETIDERATFYFPRFAGDTSYGPELTREGDHSCAAGGGAFLSTPSDLVRFAMGLGRGKLVTPTTLTILQTQQRLTSGQETGYGLGWKLETLPLAGKPARMAGHGTKKDFLGGTAHLMTFPNRGLVVAVTSNISFADMKSVATKIAQAFAEQDRR